TRKSADAAMQGVGGETYERRGPIGVKESADTWRKQTMRILQPTEWSKPRGFSHGVEFSGPGRWIVLAGQTGGDEKGDYSPDMAGQVAPRSNGSSSCSPRRVQDPSISCV